MQIEMIGLGRMGSTMGRRPLRAWRECIVGPVAARALAAAGAWHDPVGTPSQGSQG